MRTAFPHSANSPHRTPTRGPAPHLPHSLPSSNTRTYAHTHTRTHAHTHTKSFYPYEPAQVWGLDFGDCHKSLFAHGDAIMSVAWVPGTHYAFSAGKDRLLKYWDLDRFELLLELPGHHGELWALGVSQFGDFVVTGERSGGREGGREGAGKGGIVYSRPD